MTNKAKVLIGKYFKDYSFVKADIESYNNFIDIEMPRIVEINKLIEPTIIPSNVDG